MVLCIIDIYTHIKYSLFYRGLLFMIVLNLIAYTIMHYEVSISDGTLNFFREGAFISSISLQSIVIIVIESH